MYSVTVLVNSPDLERWETPALTDDLVDLREHRPRRRRCMRAPLIGERGRAQDQGSDQDILDTLDAHAQRT